MMRSMLSNNVRRCTRRVNVNTKPARWINTTSRTITTQTKKD